MKRLTIIMLMLAASVCCWAYHVEIDGIYYELFGKGSWSSRPAYSAHVTYKDQNYNSYAGDIKIPNTITYEGDTYIVRSIGVSAFRDCTDLTSIEIPDSVTDILDKAFWDCSGLTSIEIPNSVSYISPDAFSGCTGITSLSFRCKTIGNWFYKTGSFQEFGWGTVTVYNYNFGYKTNITKVVIGDEVEVIEDNAFSGFTGLTSIEIPSRVTTIGQNAFAGCIGLTSIEIPNSVTAVGENAFQGCTGLKVIIKDIAAWCGITFNSNPLSEELHIYSDVNHEINELVIPDGITEIKGSAFSNCTGLTSITIPNSVTSIGGSAFQGCTGLTSIEIPNSVITIGVHRDS